MARIITGTVVSTKGTKTIVIAVESRKSHPLYRKQYLQTKRFMAHDEKSEAQLGDRVSIVETRPLSAQKRHRLEQVLARAEVKHVESEEEPKS
jgi:small subunit ribosomal protein S17